MARPGSTASSSPASRSFAGGKAPPLLVVGPHELGDDIGMAQLVAKRAEHRGLDRVEVERLGIGTRPALRVAGASDTPAVVPWLAIHRHSAAAGRAAQQAG